MNDDSKARPVDPESIHSGPIRHDLLTDDLLQRINTIHKLIGPYIGQNLEQFEIGFMRDAHPEQEVAIWSRIAAAWYAYHKNFTGLTRLSDAEEKGLIRGLLSISMGVDESTDLGVDIRTAARLRECYEIIPQNNPNQSA